MAHRAGCLSMLLTAAVVLLALAPRGAAYPWQVCGTTGNFTANSTYQANLDAVAAALPRNISSSPDLFATAMVGAVPEQVSALALCRGDANATECSGCLATAFQDVQNMCAYDKDAAIYYDPCILYYSNVPFLSSVDNAASTSRVNLQNVTSDPGRFNGMVAALVNATADYAAHNSTRRYASGEAVLDRESEFPKVYSWAAVHAGPDAGAVRRLPRRHHSQAAEVVHEPHRRQGSWSQVQLPVRGKPLPQWPGDGASDCATDSDSITPAAAAAAAGEVSACRFAPIQRHILKATHCIGYGISS
ncbi:hypothetical protein OsJ_24579 [Oryza sativa Japonica Group]|uniref:Gnk2-homologous domain-containing protein n=1 Tax=Oryza sativa subsp. japonica TaxID=39947 RepID=A3BKP8_ORYSJ|nr:hypothetical protein OsJ_24579 [Oryza sativa Japonica Group]